MIGRVNDSNRVSESEVNDGSVNGGSVNDGGVADNGGRDGCVDDNAIKDFWQVDDSTIVFMADPTFGNILNFNVGAMVDLDIPRSFWSRLAGKYGNMFYWKEKGEDASIEAAVMAISSCLREPVGPNNCAEIK
ncbi:thylakoid lumenal 15.0 kDa protein 2, chloroplastic-like [Eutrema salsugineum]|uniref:thylakoid lumenal 15.0 kDa protein 2, chloroplastic-like n=1 Tax=Eutrema salsugineum TaxID=72664 RepID=UPI000CED36E3|nr:thylakoid lumenal 15.0 kDa protein 2, chloroplastic-like [Eutrema salsugineum]